MALVNFKGLAIFSRDFFTVSKTHLTAERAEITEKIFKKLCVARRALR
jgi:NAD dependent epimerase/dehydratase family enzyme